MPAGQDPDDLSRSGGAAAVRAVFDRAEPLVQVAWDQVLAARPLDTPERRSGFRKDLFAMADLIQDSGVRQAYRQDIDVRLGNLFAPRPRSAGQPGGGMSFRGGANRAPLQPLGGQAARMGIRPNKSQEAILAAVINHPELLHRHSETLAHRRFRRVSLTSSSAPL